MFDQFFDKVGNVRLFLSPFLICTFIGILLFAYLDKPYGPISLLSLVIIGIILGVVLVRRIAKKGSTHDYLSSIDSTPDLDEREKISEN